MTLIPNYSDDPIHTCRFAWILNCMDWWKTSAESPDLWQELKVYIHRDVEPKTKAECQGILNYHCQKNAPSMLDTYKTSYKKLNNSVFIAPNLLT